MNTDDIFGAIDALNNFTRKWCMDCKKTELKNEPIFRCKDCVFNVSGLCEIKHFAYSLDKEYADSIDFGCMGSPGRFACVEERPKEADADVELDPFAEAIKEAACVEAVAKRNVSRSNEGEHYHF